ncbi:double-strand break repair protein MRE11-like [Aphidius gifuensis]|uniref:double-strand break repair protein MRE11-like n=1 Tax=Aphidius gifuensis TaxID=684658 RepID=UPI001CDC114E|nr:double-strand break repair protein MRE11-like [Aphidius gifuensis]
MVDEGEISTRSKIYMKIAIATDCHLGYEIKAKQAHDNDSFITFEEILELAVQHDVDFVLLGGDLFHDAKPSQKVILEYMQSMTSLFSVDYDIAVLNDFDNEDILEDSEEVSSNNIDGILDISTQMDLMTNSLTDNELASTPISISSIAKDDTINHSNDNIHISRGISLTDKTPGQDLLEWYKDITRNFPDDKVTNLTTSWRNGMAFKAVIHHSKPKLM